jgi:DNA-directed RNA polymerase specialized sigma24 family protein
VGAVRDVVNHTLLRVSYRDKKQLKKLLRMWNTLETMGEKGDAVAICILVDLKRVTGIDLELYDRENRQAFNDAYKNGVLSLAQFMAISYTLVLGYTQEEIAWMLDVDQSVISRNINSGLKQMQAGLRAFDGEE